MQDFPWFAVRVRSNFERAVSRILLEKGFPTFLPLYSARRKWSDRTKLIEAPLFPGYTFCRFNPEHKLPILSTAGVAYIIESSTGPMAVSDSEIAATQTLVNSGLPVGPWPFLKEGQLVLVERGPLAGLEGLVVSLKNQFQLVVSVSLLQRSIAVAIDRECVRPLGMERAHSAISAAARALRQNGI